MQRVAGEKLTAFYQVQNRVFNCFGVHILPAIVRSAYQHIATSELLRCNPFFQPLQLVFRKISTNVKIDFGRFKLKKHRTSEEYLHFLAAPIEMAVHL